MSEVTEKAKLAKAASKELARLNSGQKDKILITAAEALLSHAAEIIQANALDLAAGRQNNLSAALLDRLLLDKKRIQDIAEGLRTVAALPDPAGKILMETVRPNGLKIQKISVPMGVIAMIYESRPNVTADAAGLCLKAGSAVILRGGTDALNSNKTIVKILRAAVAVLGVTPEIIQLIESPDRALATELMKLNQYIDLLIPRGGATLIQKVVQEATVPVIETGVGICHVYVDKEADLKKAWAIAFNAKVQRPSVCNSMETLLVHQDIAAKFLPEMLKQYKKAGVLIHGCPLTRGYDKDILLATDTDYATEHLSLEVSIRIVASLEEALEHIDRFGSKHTEAIVTENTRTAEKFLQEIDAATVIVNASTRFTDGGEFGFGCEIGISTQKLHARGPIGLPEIMTYKYIVHGSGQIRT